MRKVLTILGLVLAARANYGMFSFPHLRVLQSMSPMFNYESYVFAISWPGSVCSVEMCRGSAISNKNWNIHGLWPNNDSPETSPQDCSELNFRESDIDPGFKSTLFKNWNGLYSNTWTFLRHELSKHATCWTPAVQDENADVNVIDILNANDINSSRGFFNAFMQVSVYLNQYIDAYNTLYKAGIRPSVTRGYTLSSVLGAFNQRFGFANAAIPVCDKSTTLRNKLLKELRFCLDLNYAPVSCNARKVAAASRFCGQTVMLPDM